MTLTPSHIRYFSEPEFERGGENWFDNCSPRLLILLDTFRHLTGTCIISPHPLSIGRRAYDKNPNSQHSYDRWGEVRAIDLFPQLSFPDDDYLSASTWIEQAKILNFTGIGLYPEWTYKGETRPGLHLDVRETDELARWGYVDGKMVSIENALEAL